MAAATPVSSSSGGDTGGTLERLKEGIKTCVLRIDPGVQPVDESNGDIEGPTVQQIRDRFPDSRDRDIQTAMRLLHGEYILQRPKNKGVGLPSRYMGFLLRASSVAGSAVDSVSEAACSAGCSSAAAAADSVGGGVVSATTQTVPISARVLADQYAQAGCTLDADSRQSWDALVGQLRSETWTAARAGEARQMLAVLDGIRDQHAGLAQSDVLMLRATACRRNSELEKLYAAVQDCVEWSQSAGSHDRGVDHGHVSIPLNPTVNVQATFVESMRQMAASGDRLHAGICRVEQLGRNAATLVSDLTSTVDQLDEVRRDVVGWLERTRSGSAALAQSRREIQECAQTTSDSDVLGQLEDADKSIVSDAEQIAMDCILSSLQISTGAEDAEPSAASLENLLRETQNDLLNAVNESEDDGPGDTQEDSPLQRASGVVTRARSKLAAAAIGDFADRVRDGTGCPVLGKLARVSVDARKRRDREYTHADTAAVAPIAGVEQLNIFYSDYLVRAKGSSDEFDKPNAWSLALGIYTGLPSDEAAAHLTISGSAAEASALKPHRFARADSTLRTSGKMGKTGDRCRVWCAYTYPHMIASGAKRNYEYGIISAGEDGGADAPGTVAHAAVLPPVSTCCVVDMDALHEQNADVGLGRAQTMTFPKPILSRTRHGETWVPHKGKFGSHTQVDDIR